MLANKLQVPTNQINLHLKLKLCCKNFVFLFLAKATFIWLSQIKSEAFFAQKPNTNQIQANSTHRYSSN